jgi:hypothetical protein
MSKPKSILPLAMIFFVLFSGSGCTTLQKTKLNHKKKKSDCSLSQLVGPDTYYYSAHYQKKLKKSIKRISNQ